MRVAQSARGDAGALRLADQRAVEIQARAYRVPTGRPVAESGVEPDPLRRRIAISNALPVQGC